MMKPTLKQYSKSVNLDFPWDTAENLPVLTFDMGSFGGSSIPNELRVTNIAAIGVATDNITGQELGFINYKDAGLQFRSENNGEWKSLNTNQLPIINLLDPFLEFRLPPINVNVEFPFAILSAEGEPPNFNLKVTITLYVEL